MLRQVLSTLLLGTTVVVAGCGSTCLDRDGCEAHIQIDPCEGVEAVDFREVAADMEAYQGEVAIRGPVYRDDGTCTQLGCATESMCCNSCGASLVFGEDAALQMLGDSDTPVYFGCSGDESLICCPVPTDGTEFVVTGTLSGDATWHTFRPTAICRPEGT